MGRKSNAQKAQEQRQSQIVTSIISLAIILLLIMGIGRFGIVGEIVYVTCGYLFGDYVIYYIFALVFYVCCFLFGLQRKAYFKRFSWAFILLLLASTLYFAVGYGKDFKANEFLLGFLRNTPSILTKNTAFTSGLIGTALFSLSSLLFDVSGTYIIVATLVLVSLVLLFEYKKVKNFFERVSEKLFVEREEKKEVEVQKKNDTFTFLTDIDKKISGNKKSDSFTPQEVYQPIKEPVRLTKTGNKQPIIYHLPSINLLDDPIIDSSNENQIAAKRKGELLIELLSQFDVNASLVDVHIGPSVTKFEIKPDTGIKVSRISSLSDDIKMGLAARDIRIEAPIPGYNTVGIEIPNVKTTPVCMKEVFSKMPLNARKLTLVLGKDLLGQPIFMDLDKMPHLLVAGATGSGKSVCINTFIVSLVMRTTPEEVKLLLIDPKKVEFTPFAKLPHLITRVITDADSAARALKVVVSKMEDRYAVFKHYSVKNISSYHELYEKNNDDDMPSMPFIVVIIDELADLMVVAGKEVEGSIQRITQLARASGIYLIVATQRPSTDVITGIIKANIPSRIAFEVSSGIDSRTILDTVGAERLLGKGDMLYFPSGQSSPTRLQGVFISDEEINRVSEFVSKECYADFDADFDLTGGEDDSNIEDSYEDPMYEEVKEFVVFSQKASTSLLQRRFRLGYNRAARLIDMLELRGIIGPALGSKPRQVYIKKDDDEN